MDDYVELKYLCMGDILGLISTDNQNVRISRQDCLHSLKKRAFQGPFMCAEKALSLILIADSNGTATANKYG
jgi:hypothetical protein